MNLKALASPLHKALHEAQQLACTTKRPVLAAASIAVPPLDTIAIFSSYAPQTATSLWLGEKGQSILGVGTAYECTAQGKDRFTSIAKDWQSLSMDTVLVGDASPVALGGFRFDSERPASPLWKGFPDGGLTVPRFTIRNTADSCHVIAASVVTPDTNVAKQAEALLSFGQTICNTAKISYVPCEGTFATYESEDAEERWHSFVKEALQSIEDHSVKKIVGARTLHITSTSRISVANILRRLRRDNPAACVFAFARHGSYFVGATPEILFSANAGKFRTMALAGSSRRSQDVNEDKQLGQQLIACTKERLEHDFVVRTVLQALEPLCSSMCVDTSPSLHKLPKLQHLVTHFEGTIHQGNSLLDIIARLHPTPAVGGLPLAPALKFLRAHEDFDRGWYASPVGWLDTEGNGEFMVALRSGLIREHQATLFAGCGLVAGSNPEQEFRETQLKFTTMLDGIAPTRVDRLAS